MTDGDRHKPSLHSCKKGFTIIEIMIAITVFAIGIISINILQTISIRGNSAAKWISGRTNWASYQIEQLEQENYATITNGSANSTLGDYKATWTVVDDSPITGTKTITMEITNTGDVSTKSTFFTWIKPQF